ncbi:hypothetical protein [Nonomuraea sp. JJY05]
MDDVAHRVFVRRCQVGDRWGGVLNAYGMTTGVLGALIAPRLLAG